MGISTLNTVLIESTYVGNKFRIMAVLANICDDFTHEGSISCDRLCDIANISSQELETELQNLKEYGDFNSYDTYQDDPDNPDSITLTYCLNLLSQDEYQLAHANYELKRVREELDSTSTTGYVYLLRCGPYFKIGKANMVDRRVEQLAIQLPHKPELLHSIASKTPLALEQYFHQRFSEKRLNGEWFALDDKEISEFSAFHRMDLKTESRQRIAIAEASNGHGETVVIQEDIKTHAENIVSMIINCPDTKGLGWILQKHCRLTVTDDTIEVMFHSGHRMARELLHEDETIRTLHSIVSAAVGREMAVRVIDTPVENQ